MYRAAPRGLAWLILLLYLGGGCERRQHLVEQHLFEFGTIIEITLIAPDLRQAQDLLARDLTVIDMRNSSRPTIRLAEGAVAELRQIKDFERGVRVE